jgi:hypothetical protein
MYNRAEPQEGHEPQLDASTWAWPSNAARSSRNTLVMLRSSSSAWSSQSMNFRPFNSTDSSSGIKRFNWAKNTAIILSRALRRSVNDPI